MSTSTHKKAPLDPTAICPEGKNTSGKRPVISQAGERKEKLAKESALPPLLNLLRWKKGDSSDWPLQPVSMDAGPKELER